MEYNQNNWSAFVNGSINYNHYWKVDYFYYDAEKGKSEVLGFLGGTIKAGANYEFNKHHNAFINLGYISRAPNLDYGAFMNASTSNTINVDAKNEQIASAEIGYGFHNEYVNVAVNGYFTEWMDKTMTKSSTLSDPAQTEYFMNMTGVNARHMGIEFEAKARPTKWLEISAMLSLGSWKWDSDSVVGHIYDKHGQALTMDGNITDPGAADHAWALINMKGINVGGSAQTTANLGLTYKFNKVGWDNTVDVPALSAMHAAALAELMSQLNDAQAENNKLKNAYKALKNDYDKLNAAYNDLKNRPSMVDVKESIFFAFGSSKIASKKEQMNIEAYAKAAAEAGAKLRVIGYTDTIGSEEYNKGLAEKRAQAVADVLKKAGVETEIKIVPFGETDKCNEKYLNRRAVIEIVK